jgi:hypothetical protein
VVYAVVAIIVAFGVGVGFFCVWVGRRQEARWRKAAARSSAKCSDVVIDLSLWTKENRGPIRH